jgi:hypothetical protein
MRFWKKPLLSCVKILKAFCNLSLTSYFSRGTSFPAKIILSGSLKTSAERTFRTRRISAIDFNDLPVMIFSPAS